MTSIYIYYVVCVMVYDNTYLGFDLRRLSMKFLASCEISSYPSSGSGSGYSYSPVAMLVTVSMSLSPRNGDMPVRLHRNGSTNVMEWRCVYQNGGVSNNQHGMGMYLPANMEWGRVYQPAWNEDMFISQHGMGTCLACMIQ